jgi:hypothetical protein
VEIGKNSKNISWYFKRVIDTLKITALSNHTPEILNNYIRIKNIVLPSLSSHSHTIINIFRFNKEEWK